jgi:hypothetical protein
VADDQEIRLKFSAQTEAVEAARKHAAALKDQLEQLQSAVSRGAPGWELAQKQIAGVSAELAKAERLAKSAHAAMDKPVVNAPGKMNAGKQSMMGFQVANLMQDMIQGSPAAGINNALFMAQQSGGVKELGQDLKALGAAGATAAAGGVKALPGLFGSIMTAAAGASGAVVAGGVALVGLGTAGLVVNKGLKDAGLGWGDFLTVVGNLAPVEKASSILVGIGRGIADAAESTGIADVWSSMVSDVSTLVNVVADYTLGWNAATEETRRHNAELEATAERVKAVAEAEKELSGIKSQAEKDAADRGTKFAQAVADMGGKGGLNALAETVGGGSKNASDEFKLQLAAARKGDVGAQDAVRGMMQNAGFNTQPLSDVQSNKEARDKETDMLMEEGQRNEERALAELDKMKEARDKETDTLNEAGRENEQAMYEERRQQKEKDLKEAPGLARKSIGGLDGKVERALMLGAIGGGNEKVVGAAVADAMSRELQAKGMGKDEADAAAKSIVADEQSKLNDKIANGQLDGGPGGQDKRKGPQTIAATDFARTVQDGQDTGKQVLDVNKKMLEELINLRRGGIAGRLAR